MPGVDKKKGYSCITSPTALPLDAGPPFSSPSSRPSHWNCAAAASLARQGGWNNVPTSVLVYSGFGRLFPPPFGRSQSHCRCRPRLRPHFRGLPRITPQLVELPPASPPPGFCIRKAHGNFKNFNMFRHLLCGVPSGLLWGFRGFNVNSVGFSWL